MINAFHVTRVPLGQAIAHALRYWQALTRYLDDGFLDIDNNVAELVLRHIAIGRKNWLFALSTGPSTGQFPGHQEGFELFQVLRFHKEARAPEAGKLLTAAFILLGLRFPKPLAERLFQGVRAMEESVTYQAIIEKGIEKGEARGRVEEARRLLLRQGRIRFGPPDEATQAAVAAIADVERLERWGERLVQVTTWQELLDTP